MNFILVVMPNLVYIICQMTEFSPGACTAKHYGFVIYGYRSKGVCLWLTIEKHLANYEMWPFAVNYEYVIFYSTSPGIS